MKVVIYLVCLVLSLPNLLLGCAVALWEHTFATRNLFKIMLDFLTGVVWGAPAAAAVWLVLLVLGCITAARPFGALAAFALNAAALVLVLTRIGGPQDPSQLVVFVPLALAFVGFAWLAIAGLTLLFKPAPSLP
jgi:hypothetical protein